MLGPVFFTDQSVLVYLGYLLVPAAWYWINHTRPGLNLRAVGEYPAAADALGVNVYATRYRYVFIGGLLAGLAGATITLAVQPGWFGDAHGERPGLDRGRPRDLRPVVTVPGGGSAPTCSGRWSS